MRFRLKNLQRIYKQFIMLMFDVFTILSALYFAFVLRIGDAIPTNYLLQSWWVFIVAPLIMIPLFIRLGLYRAVLQHVGSKVVTTSFQATTISCLIIGFLMMFFRESNLPRSVIPIFWFIINVLIITSRFFFKGILYSWDEFTESKYPTIIYGAGSTGAKLVRGLEKNTLYNPIAFIDDDKSKHGTILNYLEVFPFSYIDELIKKKSAKVLFFAIPSLNHKKRVHIFKKLSKYPIEVKVLPSSSNYSNGVLSIEKIQHLEVGDILGRTAVHPKKELLERNITKKNILITGAGGSIGSELSRQIMKLSPNKIVLMDNSEFNLYNIHLELTSIDSNIKIVPSLCTVTNFHQLKKIIFTNNIDTIYHAAAYKHVPMVELNIVSGTYNNVVGTYNVAKAADELKVENMVLVSTDKAVRPTNVMGASKRMAELILQAFAEKSKTCFSMVRFGNVLDSAGSVVPLFREQIKKGGPVTVTHRNITRYFMSIPEAVELVVQAGAMAKGGDVFVLDMGEPIKIIDLAYKMIHMSGLTPIDNENPDGDIRIEYTGLRPGEKLYEELLIGNNVTQSEHPRIMQAKEGKLSMQDIQNFIGFIKEARESQDEKNVKDLLLKYIEGYTSDVN